MLFPNLLDLFNWVETGGVSGDSKDHSIRSFSFSYFSDLSSPVDELFPFWVEIFLHRIKTDYLGQFFY